MVPENSAQRKLDKGLYEWANSLLELKKKNLLDVNLARGDCVGWPLGKDRDAGKQAMGRRLCTCELLPSSFKFLSIKRFWTEAFGLMFCQQWGNGCGRGSWDLELWLFVNLWVNRVEVYTGAHSVCDCVVVCVCLALGLFLSLSFSLCASCGPCHEFSLTPWGHSHMKLWCVCPELDWQGSFGGGSRETKRKGQGFELKGFELWDAVLTYLLQNVNYLPR